MIDLDNEEHEASFDLSISDLMSSLLMVFILLLVTTLISLQQEFREKTNIAQEYRGNQIAIYDDLIAEFEQDLERWGAEIDPTTLSIRFKEPDILFGANLAVIRPAFASILRDFFPRYIRVLYPKHQGIIEEIRIEGHTAPIETIPYLDHMNLSQQRTNAVLNYVLANQNIPFEQTERRWVQRVISASGLAYSRPILVDGSINLQESRRVEFRIRTNSEEQIERLLGFTRDSE